MTNLITEAREQHLKKPAVGNSAEIQQAILKGIRESMTACSTTHDTDAKEQGNVDLQSL